MKKEKSITVTVINEKQIIAVCNQLYGNNIKLEIPQKDTEWHIYIPLEIIKKELNKFQEFNKIKKKWSDE